MSLPNGSLFALRGVTMERRRENQQQIVLNNVTFDIPATGITCLIGPSGGGKSTLLRLLNRLEDPTAGTVFYQGQDVRTLDPLDLRRRAGLVGQNPVMLPGTVRDNLEAGLKLLGRHLPDPERWLDRVGLRPDFLTKNARELSGGEKQRVALSRTLATAPEALLLDEVTSSLDPDSAAVVEAVIRQAGLPAVWVSHDMAQVRRVADCILQLENGVLKEVTSL